MSSTIVPFNEMERIANAVAKSGLFGIKTPEQALSLMAIAQAEGMHPGIVARDYHIIQGRPTLKADAMLARFQAAGGKVEWHEYTDTKVAATFSHAQGGTVTIDWDMVRAKAADLGSKDNWRKYPRNMLRARVISEGVRTVYPGVCVGVYTPEEAQDFDDKPSKPIAVIEQRPEPAKVEPPADPETGEVSPHKIAVPVLQDGNGTNWMEFGKTYAAALQSSADIETLDGWIRENSHALSTCLTDAPKIHSRLLSIIETKRFSFAQKTKANDDLAIPGFLERKQANGSPVAK